MMDFATFFSRFGASARTKHLYDPRASVPPQKADRRPYILPDDTEMPREFIRLCPWEVEYLFSIARRARIGILETGRYNGGSLFVMACAAPDGVPMWSIDIKPRDDVFLKESLNRFCPRATVDLVLGDSQRTQYPQIGDVDLLFIDGDHRYKGCLDDIRNWYGHLVPGGHLVFHDSYLGPYGVQDAIMDFMAEHPELQSVKSPFIGATHWNYPAGSIAHLIKRAS